MTKQEIHDLIDWKMLRKLQKKYGNQHLKIELRTDAKVHKLRWMVVHEEER